MSESIKKYQVVERSLLGKNHKSTIVTTFFSVKDANDYAVWLSQRPRAVNYTYEVVEVNG